jgi:hypothetical protein
MRKTKPLRKQRFNPQISAAFGSGSIKIHADSVDEEQPVFTLRRGGVQEVEEIAADEEFLAIDANLSDVVY